MISTLTARRLKPGALDTFREAFEYGGRRRRPREIVKRWSSRLRLPRRHQ